MNATADRILDAGQELIQTGGFSAMSFQDIASEVGIRKPSIIHHFPTKAELGVAIIRRYRDTFAAQLQQISEDPAKSSWDALEFYFSPYLFLASTPDKVCLCGALAGEIPVLPEVMRVEVKQFIEAHQRWLEEILREGVERGELMLIDSPKSLSRVIFNSLQGSLLVRRSTEDVSQLKEIINAMRKLVKSESSIQQIR
ncbi:MAG: TetR/AcrR family transcriptional regulator [Pseudohongiellaceae bacterium]|jgi:TetR/AcrR family transcriptional repressor of nem operon